MRSCAHEIGITSLESVLIQVMTNRATGSVRVSQALVQGLEVLVE